MGCRELHRTWQMVLISAGLSLWAGGHSPAAAGESETRLFTVRIDGRPAGSYQLTISRPDERTFTVTGQADIFTSYLFIKYRYTYRGTEVWKDGRLIHLESTTNDDGKQFQVLVQADGGSLRVRVNGKEHTTGPGVWTTTYWHAPDAKSAHQPLALLDCDTGKELRGTLQCLGSESLLLAGESQNCAHYRIRGDVQMDLWYDRHQRLVREISVEGGHRIVLELARIDR